MRLLNDPAGPASSKNPCVLLLFDIDGTLLLRASQPHRLALLEALTLVYGLEDPASRVVPAAGRTDTQIARDIAVACGLPPGRFDGSLDAFRRACAEAFARHCPASLAAHVAPGIAAALDVVAREKSAKLSLLTGNYEPIARLKLERAGIGHYFPAGQGAFGSDSEHRDLLGPIARERAGAPGSPYPRALTTVIGDTPLDIACARADGLRIVAIATGPYPAADLTEADIVLAAAHALPAALSR